MGLARVFWDILVTSLGWPPGCYSQSCVIQTTSQVHQPELGLAHFLEDLYLRGKLGGLFTPNYV